MFWFGEHKACGISSPQPGTEPAPPALEGKVLTTVPQASAGGCDSAGAEKQHP